MAGVTGLFLLVSFAYRASGTRFLISLRVASASLLNNKTSPVVKNQSTGLIFCLQPATGHGFELLVSSLKQKEFLFRNSFCFNGGSDGARTRDLRRDRPSL